MHKVTAICQRVAAISALDMDCIPAMHVDELISSVLTAISRWI